jgi:lysophospholipase L1-like esterase
MQTVLCYGDSNTWGLDAATGDRLPHDVRWPGVLRARLGPDWWVIEEGLNGRTSIYDDPANGGLNGVTHLPVSLASHAPIDVIVLFLGTNDVFLPQPVSAHYAAQGVGVLVDLVAASTAGPDSSPPLTIVVAPPPFTALGRWEPWSPHGVEESQRFSAAYQLMASEHPCTLVDLRGVADPTPLDGVHFEASGHAAIAAAVANALLDAR